MCFESFLFIFDDKGFDIVLLFGVNLSHDTLVDVASGISGRTSAFIKVGLFSLSDVFAFGFVNGFGGP